MAFSLTKLPWYGQIGAFALLAATATSVFFASYEAPLRADLESRRVQLKSLRIDIELGKRTARKLPGLGAEVDELERRLEMLRAVLPEEKDAADLLRQMQLVAAQSNLVITGFKPAPAVTRALHVEWPIDLELQGNYHDLAAFFDRLRRFTRIVNITALDLKGHDTSGPSTTIAARCVATTFVLLEGAAPDNVKPNTRAAAEPASSRKTT
jgi:type IV pilus assembly protein PilO